MSGWFWEWRCHGHLWEVIPSRRYPGRDNFAPACPDCGRVPPRRWVKTP